MGINEEQQYSILSIVAGVLHLGNIDFVEHGNYATVQDPQCTLILFSKLRNNVLFLLLWKLIIYINNTGYFAAFMFYKNSQKVCVMSR